MLPKWHVLFGFVIAWILAYFFEFSFVGGAVVFLASFFIDADHYFLFAYKFKKFGLRDAYKWCRLQTKKWAKLSEEQKRKFKLHIFIFHGLEFFMLLLILSGFHIFFFWILIGFLIHMAADIPDVIYKKYPIYFKLSEIYVWQTNKNKRKL